jgi:23S rRNA pseudouridine1911/1915/1917 synthase
MKKIIVKGLTQKERLDHYLKKALIQNRSYIDKLLDKKLVLVNSQLPDKNGQLIDNGTIIEIDELPETHNDLSSSDVTINIAYEDKDLIVINKPKHMLVHPTSFHDKDTVVNILQNKIKLKDFEDQLRPGVIHRLDRDTTGLLIIAKHKKSYDELIKQIQNKTLVRKYLALVHHNFQDQFLLIKAPIDRSKQNLLKMVVSDEPKAKLAQTEVTVLANYASGALIECRLLTGRTHQIRAHMAYIHHPVFNDELYGSYDGYKNYGQFLHAHYLSFIHPVTHKPLTFESKPDSTFMQLQNKLKEQK